MPTFPEDWTTLEAVRGLRPLIEEHRAWAHEHARMAPPVLAACRKAGVFTMVSPREVGGPDCTFPETMAVFEELGYSDPTIAWHAGNSFVLAANAVYLPEAEREAVFGGPAGPFGFSAIPGGVAEAVDGGYRVSGRWQFLTGALDAPWAWLNGAVHENGGIRQVDGMPDARAFIVPSSALVVERTWDRASAMRGTGSHAVTAKGVFVPGALAPSAMLPPERLVESRAARWPRGASTPVTNAAIAVGIARRSVEEATRLIIEQSPRAPYPAYRERPDMHLAIAAAHAAVRSYNAGLQEMAGDVQTVASSGEPVSQAVKAQMWSLMYWTLDQTRELVSEMTRISTSAVYSGTNPTELALRDLHAICASMEGFRDAQAAAGRVMLGVPAGHPMF